MDDHVAVAVLDAARDLLEEVARLVLDEAALLHDVVEELAPLDVLHDDVDVRRGLDHLVEADDVGVAEEAEDLDLAADCARVVGFRAGGWAFGSARKIKSNYII